MPDTKSTNTCMSTSICRFSRSENVNLVESRVLIDPYDMFFVGISTEGVCVYGEDGSFLRAVQTFCVDSDACQSWERRE